MSRVHDALRKAAIEKAEAAKASPERPPERPAVPPAVSASQPAADMPAPPAAPPAPVAPPPMAETADFSSTAAAAPPPPSVAETADFPPASVATPPPPPPPAPAAARFEHPVHSSASNGVSGVIPQRVGAFLHLAATDLERLEDIIAEAGRIPFTPARDALLVSPQKPKEAPSEEFRSLRTRLNHLQSSQPLHTLVVTSASPGEGKSFTACNLAMSQAQLNGKRILLADFDFRRPSIDKLFGVRSRPGLTDYLLGKARVQDILHRIEGTNLFVICAGETVQNPLELLNLRECGALIEALRDHFDWVILDSPPLLFAADGNLLATMADGTILVVRIGNTTYDSVARAIQSLCENNVLGIVVNGANHSELYSRYSYYHSYYYGSDRKPEPAVEEAFQLETVGSGKD